MSEMTPAQGREILPVNIEDELRQSCCIWTMR